MLKLGALGGFLLALPVIFWQIWLFIAPGLYPKERRLAVPFVFCSCMCFFSGAYFGFTFVFPVIFSFLVAYGTSIAGITASLSIGSYLSLATRLLMAFGLVFELPIIISSWPGWGSSTTSGWPPSASSRWWRPLSSARC